MLFYVSSPCPRHVPESGIKNETAIVVGAMLEAGLNAFSPVVYAAAMEGAVPSGYDWYYFRSAMVRQSARFLVLEQGGWTQCGCMAQDKSMAAQFNLPVAMMTMDDLCASREGIAGLVSDAFAREIIGAALHGHF